MIKSTLSAIAAAAVLAAPSLVFAATSHTGSSARSGSSTASITKTQAMNEIQGDGYTQVQDLKKGKAGWTATAMEGGKPVSLRVDSLGNVSKQ